MEKRRFFPKSGSMVLLSILFVCFAWGLITVAIHALTQNNTLGTDFYIFYHSGRAAFLEGRNPYSLDLAAENQQAIFKRPARPGEDQLGFAYPFYALFILPPLLWLPFEWAQAAWAGLLLLGLPAALLWAAPRPRPAVIATLIFLYPITFGLILGNYAVLLGALLLVLYGLMQQNSSAPAWQAAGGLILALLTVKPQLTWLYILFFALEALRSRQLRLLAWAGGGLSAMVGLSFALRPAWAGEWISALQAYAAYNQTWPTLTILLQDLLPADAAALLSVGLGAALTAGTAWFFYHWWKGRLDRLVLFAWCGLVIYLLHPHGKSYEHIAYLVPLAVWAAGQATRRGLALAFWFASLAVSWAAFFISIQPGAPFSSTEWPVVFQAGWVALLIFPEMAGYFGRRGRPKYPAISGK